MVAGLLPFFCWTATRRVSRCCHGTKSAKAQFQFHFTFDWGSLWTGSLQCSTNPSGLFAFVSCLIWFCLTWTWFDHLYFARMAEPKESKEERFVELFNSFIQQLRCIQFNVLLWNDKTVKLALKRLSGYLRIFYIVFYFWLPLFNVTTWLWNTVGRSTWKSWTECFHVLPVETDCRELLVVLPMRIPEVDPLQH